MELFTDVDYLTTLTSQYGGSNKFYSDRFVFNSQEGNGFGSSLSSLGAVAMPLIRKVLPFLKNMGRQAIKGGMDYALAKANEKVTHELSKRKRPAPKNRQNRKRKRANLEDTLDS